MNLSNTINQFLPLGVHFSQGQINFIIFFVAAFAIALVWAYRKDRPADKKQYSGVWKILISVIIIFAALSFILKNLKIH